MMRKRESRCREGWPRFLWGFAGERMGRISHSVLKKRAIIASNWRGNEEPAVPVFSPSIAIHVKGTAFFNARWNQGSKGKKQLADQKVTNKVLK